MNNNFINRIAKLQKNLTDNQAILLSSTSDVKYFTNFNFLVPEEREAFAFITKKSTNLIHTNFSPIDNFPFINYLKGSYPNQLANHIKKIIDEEKIVSILIDEETLFVAEFNALKATLKEIELKTLNLSTIENIRMIKEEFEIEKIKKACEISNKIISDVQRQLRVGITEMEVKKMVDSMLESYGADELAFPTIVAFGSHSALPHHQPSNQKLENNMPVLIDMGVKVAQYCSDITRSFWFGDKPSDKFLEIEQIVKSAYKSAFEKIDGTPIKARDIDQAARGFISGKGYGQNFTHTTGHSLGLSIHEQPSVSWSNTTEIIPNIIITIEPGIYILGEFGYRYENTVLITESGAEELTN